MQRLLKGALCAGALATAACSGGDDGTPDAGTTADAGDTTPDGGELVVPETYAFTSRFAEGQSSVAYTGQVFRHVLVNDLKSYVGGLTTRLDDGSFTPVAGDVVSALNFYWEFNDANKDVPIALRTTPAASQQEYGHFPGTAKLQDKIAGNDPIGQHEDWATSFVGWPGAATPEALVDQWFAELEAAAVARANGTIPTDPSGAAITKVHLTPEGRDLAELLQKFLLGAVAFSQGTDDYLDDDLEGKGINSDNTQPEKEGAKWTALEHAWDEAFGYFGAARDFGAYTDDELAAAGGRDTHERGYADSNGDGSIDLLTEYNFGHSTNGAKRDRGSNAAARTDFTGEAWTAFVRGRALIAHANGALSDARKSELATLRDQAVLAWEKAIAATVVHYVNEVLADMTTFGTESYRFADHAKHWSELKGFALSFQFNPRSRLSDEQFATLHEKLGDRPVLPGQEGAEAYRTALREARTLVMNAWAFDAANAGDDNGAGGW